MSDKNGKIYRFSNRRFLKETKRLEYQQTIQTYRKNKDLLCMEEYLSKYSSKTCDYEKFKEYIYAKTFSNNQVREGYKAKIFRQYKWYGYINRNKTYNKIIREIKTTYGKDIIIVYGDWSVGKQMRGFISTPNLTLKRKIGEKIRMFTIDEFRTSKLSNQTYLPTENLSLPDKTGKIRRMHPILTYKMKNNRLGCINRDKNSVRNMIDIVNSYIKNKSRPKNFKRTTDKDDLKERKENGQPSGQVTVKLKNNNLRSSK